MSDDLGMDDWGGDEATDSDVGGFWRASVDLTRTSLAGDVERKPVLERLGASPFDRGGFPLLGILATLYDHVAEHVGRR